MNSSNCSYKGKLAEAKAVARLTELDYDVFIPLDMHLRYDLVVHKNGKFHKIQVKYSSRHECVYRTGGRNSSGWFENKYTSEDFDFYALYLPDLDFVIFPSVAFSGCTINTQPQKSQPFWWYEDFLDLTSEATKRTPDEFIQAYTSFYKPRPNIRRVDRPSKEELTELIWAFPTTELAKRFGVSDSAIAKWCRCYNISKPGPGYWAKKRSGKV